MTAAEKARGRADRLARRREQARLLAVAKCRSDLMRIAGRLHRLANRTERPQLLQLCYLLSEADLLATYAHVDEMRAVQQYAANIRIAAFERSRALVARALRPNVIDFAAARAQALAKRRAEGRRTL